MEESDSMRRERAEFPSHRLVLIRAIRVYSLDWCL